MGIAFIVSAWVARYLGPNRFGELNYIFAYLAFFLSVATLGLDGVVVRDLSVDRFEANEILGSSFVLRLIAGVSCWIFAVSGLAIWYRFNSQQILLCALAGGSLIFQSFDTIDLWFQSKSQSKRTIIPKFISYLLTTIIKIILLFSFSAPLQAFAFVQTIDSFISAIGLIVSYRRFPAEKPLRASFSRAKDLLRYSYPFMLTAITITFYMRIDQLMIAHFLGYSASGVYAVMLPFSTF